MENSHERGKLYAHFATNGLYRNRNHNLFFCFHDSHDIN